MTPEDRIAALERTVQALHGRVDELTDRVQELSDREAIKDLKARYFRLMDVKDWAAWRDVFTDDAHFELTDHPPRDGADLFIATVRDKLDGPAGRVRSVHHGHTPELIIDSPTEAHGSWVLEDYLEWPPDPDTGGRRGIKGYGIYDETYRKVDGQWKIASRDLSYLRVDPLPPEPLPPRDPTL
jgi:hypothetical protein